MKNLSEENKKKIEKNIKEILEIIGEDPNRSSLQRTPERFALAYEEIFQNTGEEHFEDYTVFESDAENEMVLVEQIPFYSMCEHHLLPIWGTADVAYVPEDKVIGLSKIPRLVNWASKRPSVQEDITARVLSEMQRITNSKGVAVNIRARHMCMEMRGINKPGSYTTTSKYSGEFKSNKELKAEFSDRIKYEFKA